MSDNLIFFAGELTLISIVGGIGVLLYLLPRLARPDLYFAVTVPLGFRDNAEGSRILRRYRLAVVVHSLVALALLLIGLQSRGASGLLPVGILWQIIGSFIAFYRGRRQVMPYAVAPETIREADLTPRRRRLPGGWILQLGPFAILAADALWLHFHWEQIPERFPVHWDLDGTPNGWATRSLSGVYGPLALGAFVCAVVAVLAWGTLRWTRRVEVSGGPGKSEVRFQRTIVSILLATEYFLALIFGWTGWLALHSQQEKAGPTPILIATVVFVVLIIVVMIHTGQGGSRLPEFSSFSPGRPGARPLGDRTPDRCWKAGVFYFNPDDPAIMVEKRFGIGYTLNFGQPLSWVIVAALTILPVLIIVLTRAHLPR
jgi:uncharacterized membrane protein